MSDLERRAEQQTDEITCLRSTLAECLRRLDSLETDRGHVELVTRSPGPASRIPTRRPATAAPPSRRQSSASRPGSQPSSGRQSPALALGPGPQIRRSTVYQSAASLVSPAAAAPRLQPGPAPRKLTGSIGKLHRKWRSTSDFDPGRLAVCRRGGAGGGAGPQYSQQEGAVRLHSRGRAVSLLVPPEVRPEYSVEESRPAPQQRLRLDWVYGYRGRDARANLHLLPTGEMVYHVAAVVVLYHAGEQSQRHYTGIEPSLSG